LDFSKDLIENEWLYILFLPFITQRIAVWNKSERAKFRALCFVLIATAEDRQFTYRSNLEARSLNHC
jgi:hypothetical protein